MTMATAPPPPDTGFPGAITVSSTNASTATQSHPSSIPARARRRIRRPPGPPPLDPIWLQEVLQQSHLPSAYSWEIEKSVQRILELSAQHVALQLPDGLTMYGSILADVLTRLCQATAVHDNTQQKKKAARCCQQVSILADVTYGACCIDDLTAQLLGVDLLIHYGHSCLVPRPHTVVPCLYVFVEMQWDVPHWLESFGATLLSSTTLPSWVAQPDRKQALHIYLLGTIQFRHALVQAKEMLLSWWQQQQQQQESTPSSAASKNHLVEFTVSIPQMSPLSPGEVLGCTSPLLTEHDHHDRDSNQNDPAIAKHAIVCFIADGRFHLESTMMANASRIETFYRYDPYGKILTVETMPISQLWALRRPAMERARSAQTFGLILGTLGRQGNPAILMRLRQLLRRHGKRHVIILLSEITPAKLALLENSSPSSSSSTSSSIDAWVQVACPRLSTDWGHGLSTRPVLNPYELYVALQEAPWPAAEDNYPMDYYSKKGGPWSNYHDNNQQRAWSTQS